MRDLSNSREIAVGLWLLVLIVFSVSKKVVRSSFADVLIGLAMGINIVAGGCTPEADVVRAEPIPATIPVEAQHAAEVSPQQQDPVVEAVVGMMMALTVLFGGALVIGMGRKPN